MIGQEHDDADGFELAEFVDDILEWAADFAEERGICASVMAELLAMAAAKGRILNHIEEEHRGDEDDNGR
jgi:hypothetical protein